MHCGYLLLVVYGPQCSGGVRGDRMRKEGKEGEGEWPMFGFACGDQVELWTGGNGSMLSVLS